MTSRHTPWNRWSIALLAATLAGVAAAAGCGDSDHHDRARVRRLPPPEPVVIVPDERGYEHHGFYDRDGYWHGGYYDEGHTFRDDNRDWGRAHDHDWQQHSRANDDRSRRGPYDPNRGPYDSRGGYPDRDREQR